MPIRLLGTAVQNHLMTMVSVYNSVALVPPLDARCALEGLLFERKMYGKLMCRIKKGERSENIL